MALEVGRLKPRFNPDGDGPGALLVQYGDGEAYVQTRNGGHRLAKSDPMHPAHPLFSPALYLEA